MIKKLALPLALAFSVTAIAGAQAPQPRESASPVAAGPEGAVSADAVTVSPGEIDLSSLKSRFQDGVVKIEFTAISNKEVTQLNPTKSEEYYSGNEPPHGSGFFISDTEILTNAHVVEQARKGSIRVKTPATGNVEFKVEVVGVGGSEDIDLALLRLPQDELLRLKRRSGLSKVPVLALGDSDQVKQADPLAIFGYPAVQRRAEDHPRQGDRAPVPEDQGGRLHLRPPVHRGRPGRRGAAGQQRRAGARPPGAGRGDSLARFWVRQRAGMADPGEHRIALPRAGAKQRGRQEGPRNCRSSESASPRTSLATWCGPARPRTA